MRFKESLPLEGENDYEIQATCVSPVSKSVHEGGMVTSLLFTLNDAILDKNDASSLVIRKAYVGVEVAQDVSRPLIIAEHPREV